MKNMTGRNVWTKAAWSLIAALVLGVILAPSMTGASSSDKWQLLVKSAATVKGPVVTLGEIADPITKMDRRTWETIAAIRLWKASEKPGRPVIVSREKLKSVLHHYMGDLVRNLVLPSQLAIQTGGKVITGEELQEKIVAFLTPRASDLSDNVEFKDLSLPMNIFFDNPFDKLEISVRDNKLEPGRNQIRLSTVSSDGKVISTKAGTVFLNVWKAVPVAATPLNRFERVTKDKVTFRKVNLAYMTELWDGTGGPWRMTRTLGRGQPFTLSHVEPVPVIEKGERVDLVFKGPRVQLTIDAEALGEAGIGQQVAVRNLQSNRTVMATVIADDVVMVR